MTAFLAAAHAIAARIAETAVHHDGVCTWLAPVPPTAGGTGTIQATLGPDLYSGTAGVGLVLAEVGAATGDARIRATGLAALRHAVRARQAAGAAPASLFTGRLGVGLAALRAGRVADDHEAAGAGEEVLLAFAASADAGPRHDLVGGAAGAIAGLLAAAAQLDRPELAERAGHLGEGLVAAAEIDGAAWSWQHPTLPAHANLTGLSHGAAGIGHALSELHAATGEPAFGEAAEGAAAYERGLADPDTGNWPDLRDLGPGRGFAVRSRIAWCHGAPGIALARHRAWSLHGDAVHRREAAAGLALTSRWLRAALHADRAGFCLCHGIAGNAEILLSCADAADEPSRPALGELVEDVARLGIAEYLDPGEPWPCGIPGGESPGLMTGTAGIARFYLRLHDRRIPSLLLPGPDLAVVTPAREPSPAPQPR